MTDFSVRMKELYQKKVIDTLEKTVRRVALVVDTTLVNTTPVDTGRARANWLPSLNVPRSDSVDLKNTEGVESILPSYKVSDTIYITNNLPYIQRLNDGWSQQAPAGFVETAIEKGRRTVKK